MIVEEDGISYFIPCDENGRPWPAEWNKPKKQKKEGTA